MPFNVSLPFVPSIVAAKAITGTIASDKIAAVTGAKDIVLLKEISTKDTTGYLRNATHNAVVEIWNQEIRCVLSIIYSQNVQDYFTNTGNILKSNVSCHCVNYSLHNLCCQYSSMSENPEERNKDSKKTAEENIEKPAGKQDSSKPVKAGIEGTGI